MNLDPSQNNQGSFQRTAGRKMSYQTLKHREKALRAKFSKPWIKDEDSKSCFLCRKEFNFLFRRRHHCRKCAQVFCSGCSNYFLSTLIDPNQPIEKDSRLCQTCYQFCKEFIESDHRKNIDEEDSMSSDDGEEPESLKVVNKIEYKEQFETKLKNLIRYIFQQEKKLSSVPNFCEQYIDKTFNFTLYCLKNLRSRIRKQEGEKRNEEFHEMDINRYVIIKTCLHKDANQFIYINGIINSKNVAKKNMFTHFGPKKETGTNIQTNSKNSRNNSLEAIHNHMQQSSQPQINQGVRCMIISVSVDIFSNNDSNYPDLQQVIQKQKMYVQRIVEGIKCFKPQIIFCKENVNQDVLTQLESEKITVVQKIKNDIILKIAECARCLIVDDISIILPNNNNQSQQKISNQITKTYIGTLYSTYFKTFQFNNQSKTFMFLVQPENSSAYHVSLLINGPEIEILRQFKKNLQVILRLARHLYLEQEIIYTNNEMIKGNKKAKKLYIESLENDYVDFGNLNNFIDDKIGLGDYLYSDNAKFTYMKVQYKKAEWDQFDGVGSKEEFEKYIQDKKINYDQAKINTLVKHCSEFEHEQITFYQVKDQSLAEFLMTIYVERNTACVTCKRPMYNHFHLFVRNKCYVKLSIVERMVDPNISKQIKDQTPSSNKAKNEQGIQSTNSQQQSQSKGQQNDETMKQYQNQINHMNFQYNQNRNHARSPQKQQVEGLKKRRLHPKEPVNQYILCDICHQNITTTYKSMIGKTLIDYSYNRFLQHMFQEHSEQYKKDKQNCLKDIKDTKEVNTGQTTVVQNKCLHQIRSRVFNIRDVEIKFQVGRTNVFQFTKISFIPDQVQVNIRECDTQYYKEAYQNFKFLFKSIIADTNAKFAKLHDIVYLKKISKQQAFFNIIEMYKAILDRMESEKEHILNQIEQSKISNYNSLIQVYILEQRMNIGLNRLSGLQKEIIKKKFKQFEKQHLDETIHSDLDNSILDDDLQDLKEIDQVKNYKGHTPTLNVQEDKQRDDYQTQPFEYMPVYQKNQLSMISWALNTKQYCRFLKDIGIGGQKPTRNTLIEMLRKRNIDPNLDDKQRVEEFKIVIKIIKCYEIECLGKHDQYFQNVINNKESQIEFSPQENQSILNHHNRSQSQHGQNFNQVQQSSHSNLDINILASANQNQESAQFGQKQSVDQPKINYEINADNSTQDEIIGQTQNVDLSQNNILPPNLNDQSQNSNEQSKNLNEQPQINNQNNCDQTQNINDLNQITNEQQQNILQQTQNITEQAQNINEQSQNASEQSQNIIDQSSQNISQQSQNIIEQISKDNDYPKNNNHLPKIILEQPQNTSEQPQINIEQHQNIIDQSPNCLSADESAIIKNNLPIITFDQKQNLSTSSNYVRENLNNLFYKNSESKSSQNNLVEFGQAQDQKSPNQQVLKEIQSIQSTPQAILTPLTNQTTHGNTVPNYPLANNNVPRITHQSITSHPYNLNTSNNSMSQFDADQTTVHRFNNRNNEISSSANLVVSGNVEKISEVNILFAKQFEAFRNLHGISQERIIESLRTCAVVKLPGGQTQSVFVKSHDELFVVKEVSQLEFNYFQGFAIYYFDHMSSNPNSLLSKIFGMYQINCEGEKVRSYVVMENLFYGIEKDSCQSYDLKGSKKRRFLKGTDIGLDTNFMIDMNCEPFFIDNSTYQQFDKTIRSDSDFLAQQEIVDYSLLLIVDRNKKQLRLGIIDYFRKFDLQKLLEKNIKGFIYGEDPTIIEPKKYQERFVKTLTKKFFCKV